MSRVVDLVRAASLGGASSGVAGPGRLRVGRFSRVWRARPVIVSVTLVVLLLVGVCLGLAAGDYPVPVPTVPQVLLGGGDAVDRFTILQLRMPRTAIGVVTGFALGLAGALTQTLTRNPIASPDILGVSAGAGVGALSVIILGPTTVFGTLLGVPSAALVGGILTAVIIGMLSWRRGIDGFRLILIGIAVNAVLVALTSWMLVAASIGKATEATVWLTGSLSDRGWDQFWPTLFGVAVLSLLCAGASRPLGALVLGDDVARALGVRVRTTKVLLLLAAVGLTAFAVAAAGPIGFVAFAAPQLALRLTASAAPPLLLSALMGALVVVISDLIARTVLPVPLPVGIVTAAIGGPFLIYLIIRTNRKRSA